MRILYHHRTQADDGQAVHIRALQQAFVEEGHTLREVGLVARAPDGPADAPAGAAPARPSRWVAAAHLPRFARELAEYGYSAWARRHVAAAAREFQPDFVYERYAFGNLGGVGAAHALGVPIVLEVNSPMVLELGRTRGLSFPRLARRVEDRIFRSAEIVCAVTGVLADMLAGHGVARERLLVTPNGVHLAQHEPATAASRARARADLGLPGDALVLGFTGYYRDWHRLDLAVEALAAPELASARLALVGEGPARESLAARARELGVADRVHFAGKRPHAAVPALLAAFDVALVPAINPYASPLKLHEYMASALAIVAPDQPNLREVLEPDGNALLFPAGDGPALAAALCALARDEAMRRRLGAAARATVVARDLTWRGNARRVVAAVAERNR